MPTEEQIDSMDIQNMKKTLRFLITQEKTRQQEVEALKEMIQGIDKYSKDYVDGQNFNAFKEKYEEKLKPYDKALQIAEEDPNADMTSNAYKAYRDWDDKNSMTEEQFVEQVIIRANEYLQTLKDTLGVNPDTPVSIEATDPEHVAVKVDEDGDGTPETPIVEGEKAEETPAETPAAETAPAENPSEETPAEEPAEDEISEEDKKEIDEAVDNYKPRH